MRLELSGRARALARRFPRANLYTVGELLLIAVLAVQCARLVWVIVTPVTPLGDWRPAQPGGSGVPGAVLRGFDPFFRLSNGAAKPAAITALNLTLFGVRVNEATGGGSAIIGTSDGMQQSYAVGDEIMPGTTLKSVAFDHVSIDHGGAVEDLYIDQSQPVTPVAAPSGESLPTVSTTPHVTAQDLSSRGVSFDQLKAGIGFIPRIDGGRVTGLVLRPQGDGQVFAKAGLQQGDVATEIMGQPVTGADDLAKVAGRLKNGGILSLMVERGGKVVPIGIDVTGS
ncbi:MAG: type II secretion system protein N [Sphingomonas sp.]